MRFRVKVHPHGLESKVDVYSLGVVEALDRDDLVDRIEGSRPGDELFVASDHDYELIPLGDN